MKKLLSLQLVTYDVTLCLPCAELVGKLTDRSLVLTVRTSQPGYAPCEVKLR